MMNKIIDYIKTHVGLMKQVKSSNKKYYENSTLTLIEVKDFLKNKRIVKEYGLSPDGPTLSTGMKPHID